MKTNAIDYNTTSYNPFASLYSEYKKGKSGNKRLNKSERKAAKAMRDHRKNKTAIYCAD